MSAISAQHLKRYYRIVRKMPGLSGSLKSLIYRQYETVKAVDDVSFEIEEGELIAFIGPNGAGKTTTLKTLSGLLYPTSGRVTILGHQPFKRDYVFLKKISLVSGQKMQLWWDLPPIETFLLNKAIYEIPDKKFTETLHDLAELLEVAELLQTPTKKLSLGQRMKCELIAGMLYNPKVIFLDEPTIGLDVVMQQKMRDFIKEYNQKYQASIILTSHYMQDVQELCKRVIMIDHGKVAFDGLLHDITHQYGQTRTIKISFNQKIGIQQLHRFGKIIKSENPYFEIETTRDRSADVTQQLLTNFHINDLSIVETPVEEIIRTLFTKNHE